MLLVILVAVACICGRPAQASKPRFNGISFNPDDILLYCVSYKVYNVVPNDEETLQALFQLLQDDQKIDAWKFPSKVGAEAVLMVPAGNKAFRKFLVNADARHSILVKNVEEYLASELTARQRQSLNDDVAAQSLTGDKDYFRNLTDINAYLENMLILCSPSVNCELYSIGSSHEGRPINVFRISKPEAGRRAFWIDATIHARERIATATTLKILFHLATRADANAVRLTEAYDWYLLPVLNPDGYEYSWTTNRLWRKNRSPNRGSTCIGTDLNRNFEFRWGSARTEMIQTGVTRSEVDMDILILEDGSSNNPCKNDFAGKSAASELETAAVQSELTNIGSTLIAMITMHSFGNMWMIPWGNTIVKGESRICQRAFDHDDLMAVATAASKAVQDTHGTTWSWGNSCETIYPTTGGTDDFAKGVAGVKYAFCVEVRGDSFVSNVEDIGLSFTEVWNGVVAMCDSIKARHRRRQEPIDDDVDKV